MPTRRLIGRAFFRISEIVGRGFPMFKQAEEDQHDWEEKSKVQTGEHREVKNLQEEQTNEDSRDRMGIGLMTLYDDDELLRPFFQGYLGVIEGD